jgi:hypothetical protein
MQHRPPPALRSTRILSAITQSHMFVFGLCVTRRRRKELRAARARNCMLIIA